MGQPDSHFQKFDMTRGNQTSCWRHIGTKETHEDCSPLLHINTDSQCTELSLSTTSVSPAGSLAGNSGAGGASAGATETNKHSQSAGDPADDIGVTDCGAGLGLGTLGPSWDRELEGRGPGALHEDCDCIGQIYSQSAGDPAGDVGDADDGEQQRRLVFGESVEHGVFRENRQHRRHRCKHRNG